MKLITLDRKYTLGVSSLLLVSLTSLQAQALTVEEVPNPLQEDGDWVTDMADILNNKTETELNTLISQLEAENGAEIAVVTVPQTSPSATPKDFTTELFNHWGIGKADEDNGILFLVSTGDRRVEIETGYGIEPILPDAKVGNIIDTKITPQFKQGNYDNGTIAGTQALVNALQNKTSTTSSRESNSTETSQSDNFFGSIPFFGLIAVLAVITGLLFKRKHRSRSAESKSYTSSDFYDSNNVNGSNINSDRTTKDKSSTGKTKASSSISDVYDWQSKSGRSSGSSDNSSKKKSRRRSSRYSGSSYSGGSSSGSSSSGYSGGSSSGSSSGGYSGGSSSGGSSGGGYSGGSSSGGSSGGGGAGGGF